MWLHVVPAQRRRSHQNRKVQVACGSKVRAQKMGCPGKWNQRLKPRGFRGGVILTHTQGVPSPRTPRKNLGTLPESCKPPTPESGHRSAKVKTPLAGCGHASCAKKNSRIIKNSLRVDVYLSQPKVIKKGVFDSKRTLGNHA